MMLSGGKLALSVTFGDSSPKGGATGVPVRPHSLRGVLFYQKQKCSAVQIHDILTSIIVQKPLFLTTAHCILRHICFQQSAQIFPACQRLSLWESWQSRQALAERAFSARIPMSVRLCSLSKWMCSAAS